MASLLLRTLLPESCSFSYLFSRRILLVTPMVSSFTTDTHRLPVATPLSTQSSYRHYLTTAEPRPPTLFKFQIQRSTCVSELLAFWHENHKTLTPNDTLQCLIKVTNLIRVSKRYKKMSSPIFKQMLKVSTESLRSLTPEEQVTLLWLMAKIRWSDYTTLRKVTQLFHSQLSSLSDKSVGLIAWSLATLKVTDIHRSLMDKVIEETIKRLKMEQFQDERALANICWSLSTANIWPSSLTPHVEQFIKTRGHDLTPHTLSMLLHSLSKARVLSNEQWLFNTIADKMTTFRSTDAQSLDMILWSVGNLKKYNEQFYERLKVEILSDSLAHLYKPRLLATILWCCARGQYYDHALLDHLTRVVPNYIDGMTQHDLAMVGYSLGFLNYPCPDLLRTITHQMMKLYSTKPIIFQGLFNLLWACLINDIYPDDLYRICLSQEMINRFGVVSGNNTCSPLHIHQMLQLDFASRYEEPHLGLPRLSPHDRLIMLINASVLSKKYESRFHRNVALAMTQIYGCVSDIKTETFSFSGYTLDFEILQGKDGNVVSIEDKSRSIGELNRDAIKKLYAKMVEDDPAFEYREFEFDKLVTARDRTYRTPYSLSSDWFPMVDSVTRRIAIEVDGPIHYAANCTHPIGKTVLKNRQLKAFNWDVVSIPFFEWDKFGFHEKERMNQYLLNKLAH